MRDGGRLGARVIPETPSRGDFDPAELGLLRPAVGPGEDGG